MLRWYHWLQASPFTCWGFLSEGFLSHSSPYSITESSRIISCSCTSSCDQLFTQFWLWGFGLNSYFATSSMLLRFVSDYNNDQSPWPRLYTAVGIDTVQRTLETTEKSDRCGENYALNFTSFQLSLRKSMWGNSLRTRMSYRLDFISSFSLVACSFPLDFYFSCFDLMIHIIFLPKYK